MQGGNCKSEITVLEALKTLTNQPELTDVLVRVGVINSCVLHYPEIYEFYISKLKELRKAKVKNWKGEAMIETIHKFRVSDETVYRIKKLFS